MIMYTVAHAFGVNLHEGMTCFITRTKVVWRSHSITRLNVYARPSVCIYIHFCWNKNEHGNSLTYVPKGTEDSGVGGPIFFIFILEGIWRVSLSYSSSLSVLLTTNPMSLWQVLLVKEFWLTYLFTYLVEWLVKNLVVSHTVPDVLSIEDIKEIVLEGRLL